MSEWPMVKLGDIMRKTKSIDPKKFPEKPFKLFSIPAYDSNSPEEILGKDIGSSKILLQNNDVVLSKIVPHIRRAWAIPCGKDNIGSSEWIVFNNERFAPDFLAEYLKSDIFHQQLLTTVAGVGGSLNRARPAAIANLKAPLPPLEEQKRIAEILGKTNDGLSTVESEIKNLDNLKKSIISNFTIGHKTTKLENLATLSGGLSLGSHRKNKPLKVDYLRVANVFWGKISYEDLKTLNCTDNELARTLLQNGDIVITEAHANRLQVGRSAIIKDLEQELTFQNHLFRARPNEGVNSEILAATLSSTLVRRQLYQMTKTTSGLNTISIAQVRSLQIPILDNNEQRELLELIQGFNNVQHALNQKFNLLQELQRSLSARAFAGDL